MIYKKEGKSLRSKMIHEMICEDKGIYGKMKFHAFPRYITVIQICKQDLAFSIAHIRFIKTSSTINEKNCIVFLSFTGNLNDLNLSLFQGFKVYH